MRFSTFWAHVYLRFLLRKMMILRKITRQKGMNFLLYPSPKAESETDTENAVFSNSKTCTLFNMGIKSVKLLIFIELNAC